MKKILIYFGPKKEFEKKISSQRRTLTELLHREAVKRNKIIVTAQSEDGTEDYQREVISRLIVYSEEYAGLSDSGMQNFISLLEIYDIEELYLQNPPFQIHQKIELFYKDLVKIEKYRYKKINKKYFLKFYNEFSDHIVGQNHARDKILEALYPTLKGNKNKPIVIMLYGKSGVGKTETAKYIGHILQQKIFRKQFSMFQNHEFSNYLFGGTNSQSCFAKDLLEREANIILLDEFDKANPIFYTAFYQLFDEGIFEDKNYRVELNNAIIICTCNYENQNDIVKHLGAPIFYRFHKLIKFNSLEASDKIELIDRILKEKYSKVDQIEKEHLDIESFRIVLHKNINKIHNVRQMSNLIDDYINSQLVQKFINENSVK